jgi:hypothetical protein
VADTPVQTTGGKPIFIVGPMGSGTTLLRLIVDSHDNIAIAQETSIMRAYLAHKWIPFHRHGGDWYGRLGWSDDELDERMREFYGGMFERFAAQHGKARWGDKTPWHAWHIREINRLFPDAVIIATVRHPGAVAGSVSGRFRLGWAGAVSHWINTETELVQRGRELGDRLLMVRYEDLVLDPEATLREVFDWLGEPWSPRLLEHHLVHSERGTARKVEGATRSDQPISTERIAAWAEDVSDDDIALLRKRVDGLAGFFGYDLDDPHRVTPLGVDGSPRRKTLTGAELGRRRDDFPELVQLDEPKTPWGGNRMLTPEALGIVSPKKGAAKKAAAKKAAAKPAKKAPAPPASPVQKARRIVGRAARKLGLGAAPTTSRK